MRARPFILLSLTLITAGELLPALVQESSDGPRVPVAKLSESSIPVETHKARAEAPGEEYIIGPEDILSIVVWKEKELSTTVPVRSDGKISIPLVNDIEASGLTALQLRQAITQKLAQFLDAPEVTVMVTEVRSKRVSIMGEVEKPGVYPIHGPKSLLQLISEAGGFRPFAAKKKITVIRNGNSPATRFQLNYKDLISSNAKQDFQLKPGDLVVVP